MSTLRERTAALVAEAEQQLQIARASGDASAAVEARILVNALKSAQSKLSAPAQYTLRPTSRRLSRNEQIEFARDMQRAAQEAGEAKRKQRRRW